MISDITLAFSGDIEQAFCLLRILKYMAEDCDNEQIVVEESIKESYYNFLDSHARTHIFKNIFTQWVCNLHSLNVEPAKLTFLQNRLMDTFLAWIRLALPAEVFENIMAENRPVVDLVFEQLASGDDENVQVAANCLVELMKSSRLAKNNFASFLDLVFAKQEALQELTLRVIASGDCERAEQFTNIFVELGFANMDQIIASGSPLLEVLIALLAMEESACFAQLSFWRNLFRKISKIPDPADRLIKLQHFEGVLVKLITLVVQRTKMDEATFLALNRQSVLSSEFEEFFALRRDLASLLSGICKSCGSMTIYPILSQFLTNALQGESQMSAAGDLVRLYMDLECLLFCCAQLTKNIESGELSNLKDVVLLVQKLIASNGEQPSVCDQYTAMQLQCTNFICTITYALGKFGTEAASEVKQFTEFTLQGFRNAELTLNTSASCFLRLCQDCAEVLSPHTE